LLKEILAAHRGSAAFLPADFSSLAEDRPPGMWRTPHSHQQCWHRLGRLAKSWLSILVDSVLRLVMSGLVPKAW